MTRRAIPIPTINGSPFTPDCPLRKVWRIAEQKHDPRRELEGNHGQYGFVRQGTGVRKFARKQGHDSVQNYQRNSTGYHADFSAWCNGYLCLYELLHPKRRPLGVKHLPCTLPKPFRFFHSSDTLKA